MAGEGEGRVGVLNRTVREGFTVKATVKDWKASAGTETLFGSICSSNESLVKAVTPVSIEWEHLPRIL